MTNGTNPRLIAAFLEQGVAYFQLHNRYKSQRNSLVNVINSGLPDAVAWQEVRDSMWCGWEIAADLRRMGLELLPEIEASGHDSTDFLRFLHRIAGGIPETGGPEAAKEVWESVKVMLQRLQAQAKLKLPAIPNEDRVREHIRARRGRGVSIERITRDGIASVLGISTGAVSETRAWKALAAEKRTAKLPAEISGAVIKAAKQGDWNAVEAIQRQEQRQQRQL